MPHVIVKMLIGRSEKQKQDTAQAIVAAMMASLGCPESSLSVSIEDIDADDWTAKVYDPDIRDSGTLYKEPGYQGS